MKKSDFTRVEMQTHFPMFDREGRLISQPVYAELNSEKIPEIGDVICCRSNGIEQKLKILAHEILPNKELRLTTERVDEGEQIS